MIFYLLMLEYFIRFITIYILGFRILTPSKLLFVQHRTHLLYVNF
jgi:hypothetical protein